MELKRLGLDLNLIFKTSKEVIEKQNIQFIWAQSVSMFNSVFPPYKSDLMFDLSFFPQKERPNAAISIPPSAKKLITLGCPDAKWRRILISASLTLMIIMEWKSEFLNERLLAKMITIPTISHELCK